MSDPRAQGAILPAQEGNPVGGLICGHGVSWYSFFLPLGLLVVYWMSLWKPEFPLDIVGSGDIGVERREKVESTVALQWDTLGFDICEATARKKVGQLYS